MTHPDDDDFWPAACGEADDCYECNHVDCEDHPYRENEYENWDDPMYEDLNPCDFRDPGGGSALRNGPRIHPCPNCGEPNLLSPRDVQLGYQCDRCADQLERGGY